MPIAVEVSQLPTSRATASDVTVGGRTVRGHVAIAGTASTSQRLVKPLAWRKRSSARRAVTMHLTLTAAIPGTPRAKSTAESWAVSKRPGRRSYARSFCDSTRQGGHHDRHVARCPAEDTPSDPPMRRDRHEGPPDSGLRGTRLVTRVLIIDQNLPVPFDRRVWLECQALTSDGHQVAVVCPRGKGDPARQVIDTVGNLQVPAVRARWQQTRLRRGVRILLPRDRMADAQGTTIGPVRHHAGM